MVGPRAVALCGALWAVLAGCATTPAMPPGPQPVTSEAAFRASVVGRDLADAERAAVLRVVPNGSWLERRANHITASGVWGWIGTEWCHEGRREGVLFARRCERVVVDGPTVTLGARVMRRD